MARDFPMRRQAPHDLIRPQGALSRQGLEVLDQMYAYFDFADLPFLREDDDSADYSRAA